MKKILLFAAVLFIFAASAYAGEMTLLKRTIVVQPKRFLRYWKSPKAAEPVYNTYCWVPTISFDVLGPISGESKLIVEFDMPDGKPWMTIKMRTPSLEDDVFESVRSDDPDESVIEKQAILSEGIFPFRIKLKNALEGTEKVLFSGKIKVGTFLLDQAIPEYKGKKEFFVDYDWHLPVGYIWLNPVTDADVPPLSTLVCLRGKLNSDKLEAFLFYNGKQVAKASGIGGEKQIMTTAADEPSHRWTMWQFDFSSVRGFNHDVSASTYPGMFYLDKNPGAYEIKILRENQPSRLINFSVGKDGKIVDNGFAKSAQLGGVRYIVPAKIQGTLDGQINASAWQTEALFGNPLAGFVVQ